MTTTYPAFVNNRRFTCVSTRGGATFTRGIITFQNEAYTRPLERLYRTAYLTFACDYVVYANCDINLCAAARRLTASRFSKRIVAQMPTHTEHEREEACAALERAYTVNQEVFVRATAPFWEFLAAHLAPAVHAYAGAREENDAHHADPHPKRRLRITATHELYMNGRIWSRQWMDVDARGCPKFPYAVKPAEAAKSGGKLARGIGNLGVHASLAGYRLTALLKDRLAQEPLTWRGGEFQFVKTPTQDVLTDVFRRMSNCDGFLFVYHSDDSAVAFFVNGRLRWYNIDITSCDSSHRHNGVFHALLTATPESVKEDMCDLVNQLRARVVVTNRSRQQAVKLATSDGGAFLASGSTITTLLNNIASLCIGLAIHEGGDNTPEGVISAARRAGYVITLEEVVDFHGLQFLKHSPVRVDGQWHAMQNVGVVVRLAGQCLGDLPGRGDLTDRALLYQSALLQGVYPDTSFGLIDRMRAANAVEMYERRTAAANDEQQRAIDRMVNASVEHKSSRRSTPLLVSDEEAYARYTRVCLLTIEEGAAPVPNRTCSARDIQELHHDVEFARIGDIIANKAADVFLSMDYGMGILVGDPAYVLPHYEREPFKNV